MSILKSSALLLVAIVGLVLASETTTKSAVTKHDYKPPTIPGKCPDYPALATVDTHKMSGDWFVLQCGKDGFDMPEERGRCVTMNVVANPDGGMSATMKLFKGDKAETHSTTDIPIDGQPGKFIVTCPESGSHNSTTTLTILDSDYTNYCAGVVCVYDGTNHGLFTEIIGRHKTLDKSFLDKAKSAFAAAKITTDMKEVVHDC